MNMNAVRIPIDEEAYKSPPYRAFVKQLVQKANELELLAIIESAAPAADLKSSPNVFFAVQEMSMVPTIRATGAPQPILVAHASRRAASTLVSTSDPNIIQEIQSLPSDWNDSSAPLLINGLDPDLTHASAECANFPSDPGAATNLIENLLTQFDQHKINWTISAMEPGKLINNYSGYDWTKLDDGWTCGAPFSGAGIGMTVLAHLWRADPHGVFTVNQPAGGMVIARGANASAYGRILAERESLGNSHKLSNIEIRVTDSRGVSRPARLSWTGAGWSSTNLIIPENSAPGPAEVTVVRSDGSKTTSRIIVADAAPGLWTKTYDGRGLADAQILQGKLRLEGTGFRFAKSVNVIIDGVAIPAESFGPEPGSSRDQVTIKLPKTGETDVYLKADGKLSNVVRLILPQPATRIPDRAVTAGSGTQPLPFSMMPSERALSSPAKIQLGRYLFYDKRMSVNNSSSCATCHHQDLAFTDGRAQAMGATEQLHPRSAMSLVNLAYSRTFNWNDPTVRSLEQQALKPMRSKTPVELGLNEESFLKLIRTDETYRPIFRQAFPQDPKPYTISNITRAIAAFERTITSTSSPYDRFHRDGDETAISESAKRGEILFFLDGGPSCFRCHRGTNFSDSAYHNNGLGAPGKFKTPTLRNIAITAPYMHDGSIATLEEVVDHYATGGKTGHDSIMQKFQLTPQNRADLVAFLKTLTDENLLKDQRYSNPWRIYPHADPP